MLSGYEAGLSVLRGQERTYSPLEKLPGEVFIFIIQFLPKQDKMNLRLASAW